VERKNVYSSSSSTSKSGKVSVASEPCQATALSEACVLNAVVIERVSLQEVLPLFKERNKSGILTCSLLLPFVISKGMHK
jgi:hypothetical protein